MLDTQFSWCIIDRKIETLSKSMTREALDTGAKGIALRPLRH